MINTLSLNIENIKNSHRKCKCNCRRLSILNTLDIRVVWIFFTKTVVSNYFKKIEIV